MSSTFSPCPSCARHVRQSDSACPFCGEHVPHVSAPTRRVAVARLSRSALFAAGAAGLALATTECSSSSTEPPYGASPPFILDDAASGDASVDAADAGASTPGDAAGEAGPTEGGPDGAMGPPTDGADGG
jgi:hypothetical protein